MKDTEEAVAKVLAGLRGVEAASGLEGRVMEGVRRRMAVRAPDRGKAAGWSGGWFGLGFAALLVVLLGFGLIRLRRHPGLQQTRVEQRMEARVEVGTGLERGHQAPGGAEGNGRLERRAHSSDHFHARVRAARVSAGDAAGVTARLESFPAPPLPLTEQERLLLRLVHQGVPEATALLDGEIQAAEEAEDATEYLDFFGRPVPPVYEPAGGSE